MIKKIHSLFKKIKKQKPSNITEQNPSLQNTLSKKLSENIQLFQTIYDQCSDIVFRPFLLFGEKNASIIYLDGLTDQDGVEQHVLAPLMKQAKQGKPINVEKNFIIENYLSVTKVSRIQSISACLHAISSGNPLLLIDGNSDGFSLGMAKWEKRSIEEPAAESSIRGPREGFIETIGVNISLLRRLIKSPALKMKELTIGTYTKTKVVLSYVEGLADKTLIEEVTNRLKRIDIDGILESEYIEEMIEDNPFSPFPQMIATERPDVASSNLLEGRVVILVDGTPFGLIAPVSFFSLLQAQEDFYQRFLVSTFIRWLRYIFLSISLLFPSLYVAITTFHQEMLPSTLLLSIAAAREAVPFPAIVEVLIMEVTFEALREAGVRLPKQIGSAVSIVGALVIGEAAVNAGLVSSPMIIVVAITGIASFMVPRYATGLAIRLLRFPIIILAATLGLLGVVLGVIAIVIHLCSLRSFGQPYLAPIAPLKNQELKDVLWRAPLWQMDTRPHLTGEYDPYRQAAKQGPDSQKEESNK